MTLREFSDLYNKTKYGNVPEHCRPNRQFKDGSANELTKSILFWFEFHGIKAWRESSEGRYLAPKTVKNVIGKTVTLGKGTYIPRSKGAKGLGDVSAIIKSVFTSWEIKYGKDRQSEIQKETQKEIEKSGGKYFIVRNWDSFIFQVKPLMNGN